MTALYAIAAVIVIAGIMTGAYLIGFGDGITAEHMRLRELDIIVKDSIMEAQEQENKRRHHGYGEGAAGAESGNTETRRACGRGRGDGKVSCCDDKC